ncbi:ABC transporter permease [Nocardioides marinquilinus]|uniref:ABC transporter permease n=1 Tax=Nocardioides marinquilinus TaxID=1210400 RepID=A0ABP9Q0D8_9ACTN
MWDFIDERKSQIAFNTYQHASLVIQSVLVATVIAVGIAVLLVRAPRLQGVANIVSAIGLTLPSFALIGILLPLTSIGPTTAFIAVTFYAVLPILRNAVVGLRGVDATLLESARGMGMSELTSLWRVRLPLAWPVIFAGVRVSTQMAMGIAAIAAYVKGPGLGEYIFTGLTQIGGANAINYAVVGTVGIILVALVADALLLLLGRFTISKGIRA